MRQIAGPHPDPAPHSRCAASSPGPSAPHLLVTADDFGFGKSVSAGIIRAHLRGPVMSTGVMTVTGDHLLHSADLLSGVPTLELGLHLVFTATGAKPLAATRSSGLLRRDGAFLPLPLLWMRAFSGQLDATAVFDEICAQAQHFIRVIGRPPAYVDGHHHVHQFPIIRDALVRAVREGILPPLSRRTLEPRSMLSSIRPARAKRLILRAMAQSAAECFHRANIRTNNHFFGTLAPSDLRHPFPWSNYLRHLPADGIIEWMVHPGLSDDSLHGRDTYIEQRVHELTALTHPAFRHHWASLNIRATHASALAPATPCTAVSAYGES